jgi:Ca2+-binding RTX toxin-like protein
MKKLIRTKKTRTARPMRLAWAAALATAVAAGIAAGQGNAAPAKDRFKDPKLEKGVLTIKGTNAADAIALRLSAVQRGVLQVDVGDDGTADFEFNTADLAAIIVKARDGDDTVRIDEGNGVFSDAIPTTLDGGNGNDILTGGSGAVTLHGGNGNDKLAGGNGDETLFGDNGNDSIDGNKGADTGVLGNGNDTFIWDPGDGSDVVEGQHGFDTMVFNGAGAAEQFTLRAIGHRLSFDRDVGNITMDTDGVERVDVNTLGGADIVEVGNLSGTDVREVNVDLAAALGGTAGDGLADRVVVGGTKGHDTIDVSGNAAGVNVTGLAAKVSVSHAEPANDSLDIETNGGADSITSAGLAAGVIQLLVDGVLVP